MNSQAQRGNDRFADYVPVAERLERFYQDYPEGRVLTAIVEHNTEAGFVLMRAEVYRTPDDAQPAATGHAFEERSSGPAQRTSYIEVCETSAVGRALALLGFEVKRGIASREEMQKTARQEAKPGPRPVQPPPTGGTLDRRIMEALEILGKTEDELNKAAAQMFELQKDTDWTDLTVTQRQDLLAFLNRKVDERNAEATRA